MNPDSGEHATCPPGTPEWAAALALLRRHGATPIGYVNSVHGTRPLAEYRRALEAYCTCWAAAGLRGIFVDNVPASGDFLPHYRALVQAVRAAERSNGTQRMQLMFNMQNWDPAAHTACTSAVSVSYTHLTLPTILLV